MDLGALVKAEEFSGEDPDDDALCAESFGEARAFLTSFTWCRRIVAAYVARCVGGVVGLYLFEIDPDTTADPWIWVVTGDLPPAYISAAECETPASALTGYINEMRRWIAAVTAGAPTADLIPVDAGANPEVASDLARRRAFLERNILPDL